MLCKYWFLLFYCNSIISWFVGCRPSFLVLFFFFFLNLWWLLIPSLWFSFFTHLYSRNLMYYFPAFYFWSCILNPTPPPPHHHRTPTYLFIIIIYNWNSWIISFSVNLFVPLSFCNFPSNTYSCIKSLHVISLNLLLSN